MNILYAIQGTGNGHLRRAPAIIEELRRHANVDILISGTQADVELPYEIKYRYDGLSFVFGKNGGVDLMRTFLISNSGKLKAEIEKVPVGAYDLVISDFEPVTAWACKLKGIACVELSHQAAVTHPMSPKPLSQDLIGKAIMRHYAPTKDKFGFHFQKYASTIFTPVIRPEIRTAQTSNDGHFTVYLPAYSDAKLIGQFSLFGEYEWHVFSKHLQGEPYISQNVHIRPISDGQFIEDMASSAGVLCGAGFETPAEALFLQKKLMVIPMKNQYEQQCNAEALREMGVPVIPSLKQKHAETIRTWLQSGCPPKVNFPDNVSEIVQEVLAAHAPEGLSGKIKMKALPANA